MEMPSEDDAKATSHDWSIADYEAALKSSGYLLEGRVEEILNSDGYEVVAGRRVPDAATGVPREMDLLARKHETVSVEGRRERPPISTTLVLECINNRHPLVFFERPVAAVESNRILRLFGVPLVVRDPSSKSGYFRLEDEAQVSWNCTLKRWAAQYCTFEERNGKPARLKATQLPDHHGTFEKLIGECNRYATSVMQPEWIRGGFVGGGLSLICPVVVLQGRLLAVDGSDGEAETRPTTHIHYLRRALIDGRSLAWVIDVITEAGLPEYLKGVEMVREKVAAYCMANRERVQEALASESSRETSLLLPRGGY